MIEINIDEISGFKESQIVDVREKTEYLDFNKRGRNIPAHELNYYIEALSKEEKIVVICSNGFRSGIIARVLEKKLPNTLIYHLTEGIL